MDIVFWSSLAVIVYVFAGYPSLLAVLAKLRPRPWTRRAAEPRLTIIVPAFNEENAIVAKIENLLSLDYPSDRVEVLVGSDGSTDRTIDRLATISDARVRVMPFARRRGKPAILNALVAEARGDIVVFADVRQVFDARALRMLIESFADPKVGAVTGELLLTRNGSAAGEGSGFYWRYEKFIRSRESLFDSTVVVTGAIYALRRELFEPIPDDTIVDDLLIPLRVARRGYRVVFERRAMAYDSAPASGQQEFTRKVRTVAGAFQLLARERWVWNPLANRLWWETMSHKALRLAVAPLQLAALCANAFLIADSTFYTAVLAAQLAFYAGAAAGSLLPRHWKRPLPITFPYIFCLLSWSTVVAFIRWLDGRQTVIWEKATGAPR